MSDELFPPPSAPAHGPTGRIEDPAAVEALLGELPRPLFGSAAPWLAGSGAGKTTLLYKAYKEVNAGQYLPYPAQTIGDCVSQGFAHCVDLLAAVEIAIGKEQEEFREAATEFIYGACRVDVGGQRGSRSDGAVGAWAAKAVNTIGTVTREEVGAYSGARAKDWGAKGPPDELKARAEKNKVRTVSLIATVEELEDALANGYPVPVCSNQGFSLQRDAQGFCRAQGSWAHCMSIVGRRADARPGFCIMNSWGPNSPTGPTDLDQPSCSFWAEDAVVARMLRERDTWALSGFDGYPRQDLPAGWSYMGMA